jgi:hypothetical protein
MTRKILTIAALVCSLVGLLAVSSNSNGNLNGKWYGTLKTSDGGQYPLNYDFKIKGGQLSGVASSPKGSVIDAKINGKEFTFNVPIDGGDVQHSCIYYSKADSIGVDIVFNGKKLHATLKRDN